MLFHSGQCVMPLQLCKGPSWPPKLTHAVRQGARKILRDACCNRDTPVNPFEEVRRQPEPSPTASARRPLPAAPASAQAPFGDPAKLRLEEMAPLQQAAPATGNPESLRYVPRPRPPTHAASTTLAWPALSRLHEPGHLTLSDVERGQRLCLCNTCGPHASRHDVLPRELACSISPAQSLGRDMRRHACFCEWEAGQLVTGCGSRSGNPAACCHRRQDAEQAAETLLNLTNLVSAAPPALRTPSLAELSAASVAERGPQASPLQVLVQDIMLQQQQRSAAAQVPCCTLPCCHDSTAMAGGLGQNRIWC